MLGEEHFTTLSLLKSLANEYSISGELEESRRLYERLLAYSEKIEDQASIVETCSYLGSVHRRLGNGISSSSITRDIWSGRRGRRGCHFRIRLVPL